MGAKDNAHGNDEELHEDIGKDDGEVAMVRGAMKGCIDVVCVLEEIIFGVGDAEIPDVSEVPRECVGKVY